MSSLFILPDSRNLPFKKPPLALHHNRAIFLLSNTDSASAAAHTPSAEEAPHTPFEVAEARTQAGARLHHTSTEQQQDTHLGTPADRSSSSRVARGGVPYDCVLHGRDGRDFQREKTKKSGGDDCCDVRDCYARGSSEGANEGVNAVGNVMKTGGVFSATRDPLL
jgi:hypothetical protein